MSKKQKTCPFCGGEVRMANEPITATITIDWFICENCGATVHFEYADDTAEAIEAWNTRKPMNEIEKRLVDAAKSGEVMMDSGVKRVSSFVQINDAIEIVKGSET